MSYNAMVKKYHYVGAGLHRAKAYAEKYLPDLEDTKKMEDITDITILKQ
jgi:hypothetical protein